MGQFFVSVSTIPVPCTPSYRNMLLNGVSFADIACSIISIITGARI